MKQSAKSFSFILAVLILGGVGYLAMRALPARSTTPSPRKVGFYQDSMHPWIKSKEPGKCTLCSMELTAIYEGEKGFGGDDGFVQLSSNGITVLNVQTEEVKRHTMSRTLRVAGILEENLTCKTIVSAPAPGRIDALNVEFAGVEVEKGQKLVTLFSPELVQKRAYLRAATGGQASAGSGLVQPTSTANPYFGDLLAPQPGVVIERNVYIGQYVLEGEKLLTIVDPSVLWFRFDIYEQQLPYIHPGQAVEVTTASAPGKKFLAVVEFIEPTINEVTRTVKVRANIKNPVVSTNGHPQRLLRFGMYAEGRVRSEIPDSLAVARTAVLFPGGRAHVYVDKGGGAYEQRRVKLGRQGEEHWEIVAGLEEGESVVTSGNVLIDAQAQFNQGSKSEESETEEMVSEEAVDSSIDEKKSHSAHETAEMAVAGSVARPNKQMAMVVAEHGRQSKPTLVSTNETMALEAQVTNTVVTRTTKKIQTHREAELGRMATREDLWKLRMGLIAESRGQTLADPLPLTKSQIQTLNSLTAAADALSQALAADNLEQYNLKRTNLTSVLPILPLEFGAGHRWGALMQRLGTSGGLPYSKDLAEARKQFVTFSATIVELFKQVREEESDFAALKIYHCPMAPKPGLWMQAKGPLANPFYGAEMLTCGEEIKPLKNKISEKQ